MIDVLITSKTRIKLLLKFFLNPDILAHLRGLESEFGESSNAIRQELNRLEDANMLVSAPEGNKKYFRVNQKHPMFSDVQNILKKFVGIDIIIENIIQRLGKVQAVYLGGNLAKGKDDSVIDLIFIGDIDQNYLVDLIHKTERLIARKIRFIVYSSTEYQDFASKSTEYLLIWHG